MSRFGVSKEKENLLIKKMESLDLFENDIEEVFLRSNSPGGQNVNKVATCVQLKHIPTGIIVKSQKDRSQALNRFHARRELISRVEAIRLGKDSPEQLKIQKIRKQKKRRKRKYINKNENN